MNEEQFERLQSAVQWAVDDDYRTRNGAPRANEREWNQGTWFEGALDGEVTVKDRFKTHKYRYVDVTCGSACCVAGNIVAENGDKFIVPSYILVGAHLGETIAADYCLTREGKVASIEERALELLGLTGNEVGGLFGGSNSIETVVEIATEIAEEHGFTLELRDPARPHVGVLA